MGLFAKPRHSEITPAELKRMLDKGVVVVVDVREPKEFVQGHIPGAVNLPLSSFSPDKLPNAMGKKLVLNCLGGKRSGAALDKCAKAEALVDTHLAGGFGAWSKAGLPVER